MKQLVIPGYLNSMHFCHTNIRNSVGSKNNINMHKSGEGGGLDLDKLVSGELVWMKWCGWRDWIWMRGRGEWTVTSRSREIRSSPAGDNRTNGGGARTRQVPRPPPVSPSYRPRPSAAAHPPLLSLFAPRHPLQRYIPTFFSGLLNVVTSARTDNPLAAHVTCTINTIHSYESSRKWLYGFKAIMWPTVFSGHIMSVRDVCCCQFLLKPSHMNPSNLFHCNVRLISSPCVLFRSNERLVTGIHQI